MKKKMLLFLTIIFTALTTLDIAARNGDGTGPYGNGSCPTSRRLLKRNGTGLHKNGFGPRGTNFGPRQSCPYRS